MSEHATKPAELGTPSMSEIPTRKMLPYQPTEEMLQAGLAAGSEILRIYQSMYLAAK